MDIPKGIAFWAQIMYAVDELWSDSDWDSNYDSEVSIEGQEEFCDSSSDDSDDEPHTPESTDEVQAAAVDQEEEMLESSQEQEVLGYDSPDGDSDEDGQAEFLDSGPSSGEVFVPHATNRVQRRAQLISPLPLCKPSLMPSKCDDLRKLLERKSTRRIPYTKFHSVISKCLFKFCERALHEEAKVLLDFEADVDYRDESTDFTPLHKAVERGDAKMVEILMQNGASASEMCGETDETPLAMACLREKLKCAQIMLDHGADVNDEDECGKTALMKLVEQQKSLKVIEWLLEKGANAVDLEPVLYDLIKASLGEDGEEQPECCEYWMEVVRLLRSHGFEKTAKQAEEKWKKLHNKYKELVTPPSAVAASTSATSGGITAAPGPNPRPSPRGKKRPASEAPQGMLGSGKKQGRKR